MEERSVIMYEGQSVGRSTHVAVDLSRSSSASRLLIRFREFLLSCK